MLIARPKQQRVFFKNSVGTVITTAWAHISWLSSGYAGKEVADSDVVNTATFICFGNLTNVVQGYYIWTTTSESWLITSVKYRGSTTEFVGLRQTVVTAFQKTTAAGIISEWAFENSAGLLTDAQALNNLTNINSVTWDSGKPAQIPYNIGSARFSAASLQYLKITDAAQSMLDLNVNWTIAFWFKHVTLPGGGQAFVAKGLAAGPNHSYFIDTNTSYKLTASPSSDGTYASGNNCNGSTAFGISVWVSVAVVANGTDIRLYVNGLIDSNGSSNPKAWTASLFNNALDFCLGAFPTPSNYFNGYLAHVFVFNQAKTATQVLEWHNTGLWT